MDKLDDYQKEQLEELQKAIATACKKMAENVAQVVNGLKRIGSELAEKSPTPIDRCRDCIFRGEYHDMGATTPICNYGHYDFTTAIREREKEGECPNKFTYQDARTEVKKRQTNDD